jgi:hypothetical protein
MYKNTYSTLSKHLSTIFSTKIIMLYDCDLTNNTDQTGWEALEDRRLVSRLCALLKAYTGNRAWEAIRDRILRPCYLSREDHSCKIRTRKQRTDIGKHSFLNRTTINWNQLPAGLLAPFPCKLSTFRKAG